MGLKKNIVIAGAAAVALIVINAARLYPATHEVSKYGNGLISTAAYYKYGVTPDTIVLDLWDVSEEARKIDVLHGFFVFAEEFKDREFREIHLAYRGETKFILDGDDFRTIGREHEFQNEMYVIRTFPEKLRLPDGSAAFETWSGGLLGVTIQQMQDVDDMFDAWFFDDYLDG